MTQPERDVLLLGIADNQRSTSERVATIDKRVAKIEQHITGNGGPGLLQRQANAEKWQKEHAEGHPKKAATRGEILARRSVEVAVMALVISTLIGLAKAAGWM